VDDTSGRKGNSHLVPDFFHQCHISKIISSVYNEA
jgi:hypothetical protein